jgi:hypothetical protein
MYLSFCPYSGVLLINLSWLAFLSSGLLVADCFDAVTDYSISIAFQSIEYPTTASYCMYLFYFCIRPWPSRVFRSYFRSSPATTACCLFVCLEFLCLYYFICYQHAQFWRSIPLFLCLLTATIAVRSFPFALYGLLVIAFGWPP